MNANNKYGESDTDYAQKEAEGEKMTRKRKPKERLWHRPAQQYTMKLDLVSYRINILKILLKSRAHLRALILL